MPSFRDRYSQWVINFIKIVVLHPRLIILVPILLVFLLSYPVSYDFSIKSFNASIAGWWLKSHSIEDKFLGQLVSEILQDIDYGQRSLSRITVGSSASTKDVLDLSFLRQLLLFQQNITQSQNNLIVVSPLNTWPGLDPDQLESQTNNCYLLEFLNHKRSHLQISLFLNEVITENHLIHAAQMLHMYIIYPTGSNFPHTLQLTMYEYPGIKLIEQVSTDNPRSVADFGRFYIHENAKSTRPNIMTLIYILEAAIHGVVVLYIYLCISNQHNIRAVVQLIGGWITEVLVSSTAAVNIVRLWNGHTTWEAIFQPLTYFSRISYLFIIIMLSARNLFRIIDDLNCRNCYESSTSINKKLFQFYTGSDSLRTADNAKIRFLRWVAGCVRGRRGDCPLIPNVSKIMIVNYIGLFVLYIFLRCVFMVTLSGHNRAYLLSRLSRFFMSICLSLFIDQFLQLTYLTGIIMIDQKRLELADLLEYENENEDQQVANIRDVNAFSSFLLRLDQPPHLRPHLGSLRCKIGRALLTIRYEELMRAWLIIIPLITLVYILGVSVSWSVLIPLVLMNDNVSIVNLERSSLRNTNNHIYYMEQFLIVVFFVAVTNLIFSLTNAESHAIIQSKALSTEKSDDSVIYGDDVKLFKAIDLVGGHDIDIARIITNVSCPFIITIGLDKSVLVWSPLIKPVPKPIDISTAINVNSDHIQRFWPINHTSISNDGNLIILVNFRYLKVKLFERSSMSYLWERDIPFGHASQHSGERPKILESFFRKRTVPGLLARMILERKKLAKLGRRASATSMSSSTSMNSSMSQINSDFSLLAGSEMTTIEEQSLENVHNDNHGVEAEILNEQAASSTEDYLMVLDSGKFVTISCKSGTIYEIDLLGDNYGSEAVKLEIVSAKRLITPRVRDRIICHVSNGDILVLTVINNEWSCRVLDVQRETYNKAIPQSLLAVPILPPKVYNPAAEAFDAPLNATKRIEFEEPVQTSARFASTVSNSAIATVDFVGMVVVVNRMVAELIDILTGVVLRSFGIGHFKNLTFRVSHLEPTHCKFCGCASIQTISIIYEDYYLNTLIMHTFHTDRKRSKSNICLRVERDPREIRCQGIDAVTEDIHWIDDVEKWEVTSINMVIGVQKRTSIEDEEKASGLQVMSNSDMFELRSRKSPSPPITDLTEVADKWNGFIVSAANGKKIDYRIPLDEKAPNMVANKINCIQPYGYKAVALLFGTITKVIYLGNNKLIENELYFSGTDADSAMSEILEEKDLQGVPRRQQPESKTVSSELLFINKRRKLREKSVRRIR